MPAGLENITAGEIAIGGQVVNNLPPSAAVALFVTFPTSLAPFYTWLLIGYFKSIPCELAASALIDCACRLQILRRTRYPHRARPDLEGHCRLYSVTERIQDERPGGDSA